MTAIPSWVDAEAWSGYVEMRKAIRKPMTARAEMLVLKTLYQLKEKGHDPNAALDESVIHNWTDVYEPKPKQIANLVHETYQGDAPMTPEEKAKADAARELVMQAFKLKRVA